ncbi:ParA family protein [Oscillochloris sp. ZM17-4]|uniref:ParA family protein n=1 Tax=Oscillochloris sp. ZM17-4 TaxID=2866714 RepID=UPI0021025C59|nr:ParA family protein [Oscillochloris sp. ZM17-4]
MITYAVALEKGGVGKTALSVNLAAAFQQAGLDVLLVDLDAQASATHWLGIDVTTMPADRSALGVFNEAIAGQLRTESITDRAIPTTGGVHVLAAHPQMASLPSLLNAATLGGIFLLSEALDSPDHPIPYDVAVLDLPPARSPILGMALAAATRCLAPVQSEDLVIRALVALMDSVTQVRVRKVNPQLQVSVLRNKYMPRSGADRVYDELLRDEYRDLLLDTVIPVRAALRDSVAVRQDIFHYSGPDVAESRALFLQLVGELIKLDGQR